MCVVYMVEFGVGEDILDEVLLVGLLMEVGVVVWDVLEEVKSLEIKVGLCVVVVEVEECGIFGVFSFVLFDSGDFYWGDDCLEDVFEMVVCEVELIILNQFCLDLWIFCRVW